MTEKDKKRGLNFIDSARIHLKAGKGGDGCVSFRREKYRPRGGPDGGNGGKGGDVIIRASKDINTLYYLSRHPNVKAENGLHGRGGGLSGKNGESRTVMVPPGTVLKSGNRVLADLKNDGDHFTAARGGRGGRGNAAFKTHKNPAPKLSEKGEPGKEKIVDLELSILADVGLIGFPNAGKSTLLAKLTNARPKIADYPFTTLNPNLGVVFHKNVSFVLADIPGLIEGAHRGKGLGDVFLKHIMRTRLLLHVVDPLGFSGCSAERSVAAVNVELENFHRELARKKQFLLVNKSDLPESGKTLEKIKKSFPKKKVFLISAFTGKGLRNLLDKIIETLPRLQPGDVFKPGASADENKTLPKGYEIFKTREGEFEIKSENMEKLASMTNFDQPESLRRLQKIFKATGLEKSLKKKGVKNGDQVRIGNMKFEWEE